MYDCYCDPTAAGAPAGIAIRVWEPAARAAPGQIRDIANGKITLSTGQIFTRAGLRIVSEGQLYKG